MCAADFKSACGKAGLALIIIFAARCIADAAAWLIGTVMSGCDSQIVSSVQSLSSIIILYGLAIAVTARVFGYRFDKTVYKKPKRLGKAISWFVPMYGAGQIANIIVLAVSFLLIHNQSAVEDTLTPIVSSGTGSGAWYLAFLFIQMVILAPLFEEYWFRGVIQTSLMPYGMAHGNIHQFCYTFIVGICLGYVRYATGSIMPTTIMHAMFNSIAAIAVVAVKTDTFVTAMSKMQKGSPVTSGEEAYLTVLMIYVVLVLIIALVGMGAAIGKLKNNRLYRPVNNYPELSKKQKFAAIAKNPLFIVGFLACTAYIIVVMII